MSGISLKTRLFVTSMAAMLAISLVFTGTVFADDPQAEEPGSVDTASDASTEKLHPELQSTFESGTGKTVTVFVTATGNGAEAASYLEDAHVARAGSGALIVGRIPARQLAKLASLSTVVGVGPVDLRKTGQPLGIPDPDLSAAPDLAALRTLMNEMRRNDVPYSQAPRLRGSKFEQMRHLPIGDQESHGFSEAWDLGYTGEGVTVGVLDGGTDFAHPDLLGTWKVWPNVTSSGSRDAGWSGWPMALDPYDTLVWLVAPSYIDLGLTWYTPTTSVAATKIRHQNRSYVDFATRTGPSRNFSAPSGTVEHRYTFPSSWSKSGTVFLGSHPDDHLLQLYAERPAFLVTDPHTAGVYDTVYVDLDDDFQFGDEKPVTKASPASYRDMNGDGYTDISGGLLYYISDGTTRIPGGLTTFGLDIAPGAGEMLAWTGDFDPAIEGHGTLTASNIVGQAVIGGKTPTFKDIGRLPAAVLGGAPKAKLAPFGDIYFSFDFSTQFGYFLANQRGVDVTSNSYGASDVDNDGYDNASQEADVIHNDFGGFSTPIFSTGNGAPGFGTTSPPAPAIGIKVGASTQFGATGWDSIKYASQVTDNDVMVWSNRGPGATGAAGVDVVADGAFSPGDVTLNSVLDGRNAWTTWGGTSRSTPVAAGATALVYQAWRANQGTIPAFFAYKAKEILKSSAQDLGYDPWLQGGGSVDAGEAVKVAAGHGASVSPSEWRPGDYRGDEWEVFTHLIAPGESDSQEFDINGPGTFAISDRFMTLADSVPMSFTSSDVSNESVGNFNAPDYLINISNIVAHHPHADLMVVRMNYAYDDFDLDGDYAEDNQFRLLTYNWTDVNHNHRLWRDMDHDGVVDHTDRTTSSNIDGFLDLNFNKSEMEEGEYVRFMYHRPGANTLQSFVRDPADRMADGIFIGLQHNIRTDAMPQTTFDIQIDFYENSNWSWVSTPSSASGSFQADIHVPDGTPFGMYEGAIVLKNSHQQIVVPVSVTVGPTLEADSEGNLPTVTFGGDDVAEAQSNLLYNNGAVFGSSDWTWRAESGDWRFFYFDVDAAVADGTLFLADTTWDDVAPHTDLDTLIFGPAPDPFGQVWCGDCLFGAPYVLNTVGGSPNTNVGGGVWIFNTGTGGAHEFVTAPASDGLHAVVQHQVLYEGDQFWTPFETTLGTATVAPTDVAISSSTDTGSFDVTFKAGLDLDGLTAEGFGLSQTSILPRTATQDDPDDPSTASVKEDVTLNHASTLRVSTDLTSGDDIDLFVVFDADNSGTFGLDEIVGASTMSSGEEFVELVTPPTATTRSGSMASVSPIPSAST